MKQFKTQSKRILDLMINSIYTNKEIFLREIISNASDAIDKLKFVSLTDGSVKSDFEIEITLDKVNKIITVKDGGIGMTDSEMESHLGTVAESGTLEFKKQNEQDVGELIGQFGVGFYSAFMVAEKIEVLSKAHGSDEAFLWESYGVNGYDITPAKKDETGTEIKIYLKEDGDDYKYSDFLQESKIESLVKRYSDYIRYPIKMFVSKTENGTPRPEYKTLNSMIPLWKKKKSDVSDDDLKEFYQNEFHDFAPPLKSIYAKIEGLTTYDTLLFIPSRAPVDYYSKDYKKGVKLYCNGVMIMEKCEDLIPDYFGFVRGVVDSADLNLNISREILQQDRQVKHIATSLEKRILSELKKLVSDDRETYEKLFAEFGLSIKFGVYAGFGAKKDDLQDLLMFYSAKEGKLITLKDYVDAMAEKQQAIYYACGENYDKIALLPQIEKAKEKGYDVLFFKDGVDEFVAKVLISYSEKKFVSVSEAEFNLLDEEEKKDLDKKDKDFKAVSDFMKDALGGKVKEVKLSMNLKTYPVCITSAGDLTIEMEKVLNSMPNADGKVKAEKVLELNAEHPVIEKLKTLFETDKERLKKYALVLYEQARLIEGLGVEDTGAFVLAMADLL